MNKTIKRIIAASTSIIISSLLCASILAKTVVFTTYVDKKKLPNGSAKTYVHNNPSTVIVSFVIQNPSKHPLDMNNAKYYAITKDDVCDTPQFLDQ